MKLGGRSGPRNYAPMLVVYRDPPNSNECYILSSLVEHVEYFGEEYCRFVPWIRGVSAGAVKVWEDDCGYWTIEAEQVEATLTLTRPLDVDFRRPAEYVR